MEMVASALAVLYSSSAFESAAATDAASGAASAPASSRGSPDARAAPASYAMLGFGQPAAPEQAAPSTGSGRAAAQEAARRIREQS